MNPVGTVKNISVSVLVADKIIPATKKEPEKTVPRSKEELESLKKMIASALGLDPARGDKIEITSMPFTEPAVNGEGEAVSENILYQYMPIIRYAVIFIGGLLVYFLMIRPIIKTLREDVTQHYKTVQQLEEEQKEAEQEEEKKELEAMMRDPLMRVRDAIQTNPVFAAHILKNWIHDKG